MRKRKKGGSISLSALKENSINGRVKYPLLVSALLIMGTVLLFVPSFESIAFSPWIFGVAGIALCSFFVFLLRGRFQDHVLLAAVVLCAVFSLAFFGKVKSGILILANDFLKILSTKTGHIYLAYETGPGSDALYISVILLVLLCAFIAKAAVSSRLIFIVLPPALFFAGAVFGFIEINIGFPFLAAGLILLHLRGVQLGSDPGCSEKSFPAHALAALLCFCIMLSAFLLPELKTGPLLSEAKSFCHGLIYDEKSNSMPEGDLSDLPPWRPSGSKALAVTAGEYSKLYLRGFTGEVYTGTSWEGLDKKELAEKGSMFYWLHEGGFYAQTMAAKAQSIVSDDEPIEMSIENLSACRKYAYLPYSAFGNDLLDPLLIGDLYAEGSESEKLSYYPGSIPQWYEVQHKLALSQGEKEVSDYLKNEQQYRDFVFENYLQLTPAAVTTLKEYLDSDEQSRSLSEIRQIILKALDENISYDENASVMNGKGDFLTCLFEQEGKGYSVAYATSAALMLRYYGVPARYVEGYYLSGEEAEELNAGDRCVLDEYHAHAWAEYYLDGIGWIPFEVTPGYIDEKEYELGTGGSEGGAVYEHNELVYSPAPDPKPMEEESGPRASFKITLPFVLVLAAIALAAFMILCAVRRIRLRKALERIRSSENRSCIAMLYGYADMLLKKAKIDKVPESYAQALNKEAMFSGHDMTDGQKEEMEKYVGDALSLCKEKWKLFSRVYYRFVDCIYIR